MPHRPSQDWPRLSGRPERSASPPEHPSNTVFRRFFELIERLEKPRAAPLSKSTASKAHGPQGKGRR